MSLRAAILWNLLTVSLAALVAFFVAKSSDNPETHSHTHDHHHHHEGNDDFHQWLHRSLKLTDEQDQLLRPIEEKFILASREQENEIKESGKELATAIRNYTPGQPDQVEKALARLNRAQLELQKSTLTHFFEMKEHLTPEQGEMLLKWTHDSIIHGKEH